MPLFDPDAEDAAPKITPDLLKRISEAARLQVEVELKIVKNKKEKTELEKQLITVAGGFGVDGTIPTLLAEGGVKAIDLTEGVRVQVNEELKCPSMAADSEDREKVLAWADRTKNDGIIQDFITIPFDKGSDKIKDFMKYLQNNAIQHERYRSINAQTLKALFNEILNNPKIDAEGKIVDPLPMVELNIRQYKQSEVKPLKVKKK